MNSELIVYSVLFAHFVFSFIVEEYTTQKHTYPYQTKTFPQPFPEIASHYLIEETLIRLKHKPDFLLFCNLTHACSFAGPIQGFLPFCLENKTNECLRYNSLDVALSACGKDINCNGITVFQKHGRSQQYTLTTGLSFPHNNLEIRASRAGELTYAKVCKPLNSPTFTCEKDHIEAGYSLKQMQEEQEPPLERSYATPVDPLDIGYTIQGNPTIFVGIASYRDELCRATVEHALSQAEFPERLVFGIVEQNSIIDIPCVPHECSQNILICNYRRNIRIHRVSSIHSRGPIWARHRVNKLYNGETFALQIDAHMLFVEGWDSKLIEQWIATENEYAVLSSYPTDVLGAIDQTTGKAKTKTRPVICGGKLMSNGIFRFDGALEVQLASKPTLQPFWAAGMSFSKGHLILNVPYDCCADDVFMGEEFSMAVRLFTSGYDIYSPAESLIFHYVSLWDTFHLFNGVYQYPKSRLKALPLFWENHEHRSSHELRSLERLKTILDLPVNDTSDFPSDQMQSYGLGRIRNASHYYHHFIRHFGVEGVSETKKEFCSVVLKGKLDIEMKKIVERSNSRINYDAISMNFVENLMKTR